jgi:hypothetical protein
MYGSMSENEYYVPSSSHHETLRGEEPWSGKLEERCRHWATYARSKGIIHDRAASNSRKWHNVLG